MGKTKELDIIHDAKGRRFYTMFDNKEYSLEYNEVENDLWEFHCNYIPEEESIEKELREDLINYAIYYMARNNIRVLETNSCHDVGEMIKQKRDLDFLIKYINPF